MEKVSIYYKSEVTDYINELVYLLFKENYFSYVANVVDYKYSIIGFIENNVATFPFRYPPIQLKNLGSKHIFFKSNYRTTLYVFFENKENNYVITFITNNHSKLAQYL